MFDNIGGKIKGLAKFNFGLGMSGSIIFGVMCLSAIMRDSANAGKAFIVGMVICLGGTLLAWLSSLTLYGFGELIEKVCLIEKYLRLQRKKEKSKKQDTQLPKESVEPNEAKKSNSEYMNELSS